VAGRPRLTGPLGSPTRGTTNPNRLRRVDRWLVGSTLVRSALSTDSPLVVDVGYGASPVTTVELAARLRSVHGGVRVLGLELDPERVALAEPAADPPRLAFAPGGLLVEGTCDELGRRCCWVTLSAAGPRLFTLACRPADLERPSDLAERLPKSLIHRNVPGEPVHALFATLDRCWATAAPFSTFGPRARWVETARLLAADGWPVQDGRKRWRLGELTLDWTAVAPT
jgi:hypothetical protein